MTEVVETLADNIHVPVARVQVTGAVESPLQNPMVHHLVGFLKAEKKTSKFNYNSQGKESS